MNTGIAFRFYTMREISLLAEELIAFQKKNTLLPAVLFIMPSTLITKLFCDGSYEVPYSKTRIIKTAENP